MQNFKKFLQDWNTLVFRSWDIVRLKEIMPEDVVKRIMALSPLPLGSQLTILCGHPYQMERLASSQLIKPFKTLGPKQTHSFLWLAAHQAILTNAERKRCHLTQDSSCPRCTQHEESVEHVLRDCYVARNIWNAFIPAAQAHSFFNTDASNLGRLSHWHCLFGVVIAFLWFYHNKFIFEGKITPLSMDVHQIKVRTDEILKIDKYQRRSTVNVEPQCPIRWLSLPEKVLKLNVDGSYLGHLNSAACGGLFRDHLWKFILDFSCNLGSCSITHAELWGIAHGLQIANAQEYTTLIVESDSASALHLLKNGCPANHPCAPLVEDIGIQAGRIANISWSHSLQEANSVADVLAKKKKTKSSFRPAYFLYCSSGYYFSFRF
ncbi:hypothetical protein Ahy_A06g026308 [Arachis hypogaea]|uniref:Uncharacterized protein n=1 Tax=Arachis hypogaea TaxID=3818 RepID=A0A445CK50_ARAHY|nr:hypothetical protein Ahy_A06g026308 [Arachis hypogaea]